MTPGAGQRRRGNTSAESVHEQLGNEFGIRFGVSQHYLGDKHTFAAADGNGGLLKVRETDGFVVLDEIQVAKEGTGLGSRIVEQLKSYCDSKDKVLRIPEVENQDFFERFDWLEWHEPEGDEEIFWSCTYDPASAR